MADDPGAADWQVLVEWADGMDVLGVGPAHRFAVPPGIQLELSRSVGDATRLDAARHDLVAVLDPDADVGAPALRGLAARHVRPGGSFYAECRGRRGRALATALAGSGWAVSTYWPRRGFTTADLWLPIGDRGVSAAYADTMVHRTTILKRAVGAAMRPASRAGLLRCLVPFLAVVAVRNGECDAPAA